MLSFFKNVKNVRQRVYVSFDVHVIILIFVRSGYTIKVIPFMIIIAIIAIDKNFPVIFKIITNLHQRNRQTDYNLFWIRIKGLHT